MLDFNSSVEVGYGFHAFISKLLIVNDMYWEREKRSRRGGKHQALRINLLDFNSSVEVGYGFPYDIHSKLLIENDMY